MLHHDIEEISPSYGNTLLAQGAFGEVRIGLKVNNEKRNGVSFLERRFMQKVEIVAIKTIRNSISLPNRMSSWGFHEQSSHQDDFESNGNNFKLTKEAFCELAALRVLQPHENIVPLLDIIENSTELKLVFPYYPLDLYHIIHSRECNEQRIPESIIRVWVKDMLKALAHCHSHGIIHGDIKPSNFLISSNGTSANKNNGSLILCDFGLAQLENTTGSGGSTNNGLCTLHYRPPELLLGSTSVTTAVDVWSCACIIGELYNFQVIFPGRNVLDQLTRIFQQLGFNHTEEWYTNLPDSNKISFQSYPAMPLYFAIPRVNENSNLEELISTMLSCDPTQRPTSQECLEHSYFFLPANTNLTQTIPNTPNRSSFNWNFDNLSLEEIKQHAIKVAKERRVKNN